jgi:hypothetical protein
MTERDLFNHVCQLSGLPAKGYQPPYCDAGVPVHPTEPVDYGQERERFAEGVLGESDFIYHPRLGCPHVDILRYPATSERPFCVYLTNGMSDFPLMLPEGGSRRVELVACTKDVDTQDINSPDSITQVLRYISVFPFLQLTSIDYFHTIELPIPPQSTRPRYVVLIPPFLLPDLGTIDLMGQQVRVISILPLSDQDFHQLQRGGSAASFIQALPDSLETWLFDASLQVRTPPSSMRSLLSRFWKR